MWASNLIFFLFSENYIIFLIGVVLNINVLNSHDKILLNCIDVFFYFKAFGRAKQLRIKAWIVDVLKCLDISFQHLYLSLIKFTLVIWALMRAVGDLQRVIIHQVLPIFQSIKCSVAFSYSIKLKSRVEFFVKNVYLISLLSLETFLYLGLGVQIATKFQTNWAKCFQRFLIYWICKWFYYFNVYIWDVNIWE